MRPHGRRSLVLAIFAVVGLTTPAGAQGTSDGRPAAGQGAPAPAALDSGPPFWVAGVVIGPARNSAVLVPLDHARRELGVITLREGESYDGHRLVGVEPARVLLERDGKVFELSVGRPFAGPRGASEPAPRVPIFIPGPDKPKPDVEYTGPQVRRGDGGGAGSGGAAERQPDSEAVQNYVERLFSHPQFQQQIEEIRPIIRQKMDRARQDGQPPSAPPSSSPAPSR